MNSKDYKHVMVRTATHRKLLIAAAVQGRKAYQLADEILSKALGEMTPHAINSTTAPAACDR
ncbi:MAG: hypothetical protein WC565_10370 [Parcubacteria group bacterium]